MGKAGEKQKRRPKIKDSKQSERFKEAVRELGADIPSRDFGRIVARLGKTAGPKNRAQCRLGPISAEVLDAAEVCCGEQG